MFFWQHSNFIDSFDPGYDQEKINEIAESYGFTDEEISTLTTPEEMTFSNERQLEFCLLVKSYIDQKKSLKKADIKSF